MPSLHIVGASARAAAQSAHRAGFDVATVDLFADADLREFASTTIVRRYPHGLFAAMNKLPPGPWMYTGALENYPTLVDRLANSRVLLGNAGRCLRGIREPTLFTEALHSADLPYAACRTAQDAPPTDGSWLIKPRRSGGGTGISPWTGRLPARTEDGYFQARIAGQPVAAVFVGNSKQSVLLGVTQQIVGAAWTHAGEFQYSGSVGPLALPPSLVSLCREIGEVLCRRFGLSGLFGVDAILTDTRIVPVEINPRFPSSVEIIERASSWSAVQLHVEACRQRRLPNASELAANPHDQRLHGKAILYAPRHLRIEQATHDMLMQCRGDALQADAADIPIAGCEILEKRPVLTIFAEGTSRDDVVTQLKEGAANTYDALFAGP